MMERGTRIELVEDFGIYRAGQQGIIMWIDGNEIAVDLDGYETERAREKQSRDEFSEGPNEVPWLAEIDSDKLKEIP